MNAEFMTKLNEKAEEVERIVDSYLPKEEGMQQKVFSSMAYSVKSGGKRLRPIMMLEIFRLFSDEEQIVYPFMAAIEMLHTAALIHDDLPALDNDDLRRGRATNHKVYGEAIAILAGDSLLNLAFETTAGAFLQNGGIPSYQMNPDCKLAKEPLFLRQDNENEPDPAMFEKLALANHVLALKAGSRGMLGGQVADMEAEKHAHASDMTELMFIHTHKTAALVQAALMIGGILGGAEKEQIEILERIGSFLGLAFQIKDDILDVIGDTEELGKPVGSDEKNEKCTFVSLVGLEEADKKMRELSAKAAEELSKLPGDKEFLTVLFAWLTERNK